MGKTKAMQQLEQLVKGKFEYPNVTETIDTIKNLHVSLCCESEANEIVVSFINKLLNTSGIRPEGLKLLNAIIFKIPQHFILDNYLSWIPMCLCLNNIDPHNDVKIQILVKIIRICNGTQDFDKFLVNHLQKLIEVCLSAQSSSNINESTLDCIKICLEKYPSTCTPSKSKLEQSLAQYIPSDQPRSIIRNVGTTFHLLQQIAGCGPNSTNQKTNWTTQFYKLCTTLHNIYNDFFQGITEYVTNIDLSITPFSITEIENTGYSTIKMQNQRAIVLRNLVIFLDRMLVESYSHTKSISIPIVLNVFKRGLMVDVYDDCHNSIEETQFSILLYNHQIELLHLMRSFIACFKKCLIPFSVTISKIIIDCLQRTQKQFFKNSCKYQAAVYKVLSYWICTVQNKINSATHNKIVSTILIEITPKVNTVVLSLNKDLSKDQAATVRRKELTKIMTNQLPAAKDSISRDFLKMKENKCLYALKSCIALLENVSLHLDENNFNAFFKTITSSILLIHAKKADHPYTNANCAILLYKVLHAFFHQHSYCVRPLIQITIRLFTTGQNLNFNKDVTTICNYSLDTLEKLCQPLCPSLSIPMTCERLSTVSHRTNENRQLFKEILDRVSNDSSGNYTNTDAANLTPSITITSESSPPTTLVANSSSLSQPVKPLNKINILDIQVVKQGNDINVVNPEDTPAISIRTTQRKRNNKKEQEEHVSEHVKSNLEEDSEISLYTRAKISDEPSMKQIKIDADNDEEELMLASFNDSINYL